MAAEVEIVVNARDNFSGTLGNFGNIITGINSLVNLAGDAFRFFGDAAMEGLDAIAQYERMSATLETLVAKELLATEQFENMGDALAAAAPQAEELLDWIQQLAINSPFTAEGVANAFRLAQAYGFSADEAQRLTQAMIDFAAGSGASEQTMSQIALALGQIEAKGKLAGQEVLQLVNAGLPVTQILAEAFGVTTAELVKMQEDGLIPAHEAIEAITVYLETNFAGAAERQANTWAGLQGTFADIKQMGLREFFGGMFDVLQPLAVSLSEFLQTEGMDRLAEWGAILGQMTADLIEFGNQIREVGFENFDWGGMFEDALIAGIEDIDWNAIGLQFNQSMQQEFDFQADGALSAAIGDAFTALVAGGFGYMDWDSLAVDFREGVLYVLHYGFDDLGRDIGLFDTLTSVFSFGFDDLIRIIKNKLGIASPSTVFTGIARDMVAGLVSGWSTSIGGFIGLIEDSITGIIDLFPDWLQDALGLGGADAGNLGTASGGTVGGTVGGGPATQGGSNSVVNNYYGPVYFGSTGEPNSYYDCPSPNPIVAASGNQLVVTGF